MSKASRRKKKNERLAKLRREQGRRQAALAISGMADKSKQQVQPQQLPPETIVAIVRQEVRQEVRHFAGPLPPPEILKEYNEVLPGAAERIFVLLEKQTDHRISLEKKVLADENRRSWGGLFAGLIVVLACLTCGTIAILNGHDWAGGTIITGTVASLATVFVIGHKKRSQERVEKVDAMTGKK